MPLGCGYYDGDCEWYFVVPDDYSIAQRTKSGRRKKCSCGTLINPGEICLVFDCSRTPRTDIEERIYGDEVPLANRLLCERCADLYFSFFELGFNQVSPNESMPDLAKEYAAIYRNRDP